MRPILLAGIAAAMLCAMSSAEATVTVAIDLTHQRMHVEGKTGSYDWPISSARSGFYTPGGSFAPTHLEGMHYSKKYHMSPMPHAIFFRGGYAIHGTYATGQLGRPASHGCVRLSPGHAAELYGMVQDEGARISISGTPPASRAFADDRERRRAKRDVARRDALPEYTADVDAEVAAPRSRRHARRIIGYVYPTHDGGFFGGGLLPQAGPLYTLPPD